MEPIDALPVVEVRGFESLHTDQFNLVLVAQLAEASRLERECWGFESLRGHQFAHSLMVERLIVTQVCADSISAGQPILLNVSDRSGEERSIVLMHLP